MVSNPDDVQASHDIGRLGTPTGDSTSLPPNLIAAQVSGGRIAENVVQFARLLRAAGLAVGPDRVVLATEAILATGIERQGVLYAALAATFVSRPDQREVFDQAFYLFWKDPRYLEQMLSLMLPSLKGATPAPDDEKPMSRRLRDVLTPSGSQAPDLVEDEIELDLNESWSRVEVSRTKDFEQMSAAEQALARAQIRRMALVMAERPTRRYKAARRGARIDMRRVLAEMAAKGPDHVALRFRTRVRRPPPLVVLADISGSMDTYARMLLHFLHALAGTRTRVSSFLFGTRLWNITRLLRDRDPDAAIARVSREVTDWSGGTRIAESLNEFNRLWARRVLGQNATVLLITDGLDREGAEALDLAARRLRASCRRLVWLNPLLRYDAYAPIAAGARSLNPHVSELRACHNLASLESLAEALAR